MLGEGDAVPEFEAEDADGGTVGSASLRGSRYVVYFYPRDFTPGCTVEAGEFAREYPRFRRAGIEVVGVSPDGAESHRRFREKTGARFPLLADTDRSVSTAFGAWGKKKMAGREYMGVVRSTFLVDESGTVFRAFPKVKPAGHAAEVLASFASK